MKILRITLLAILMTSSSVKAACNKETYREAKIRCASSLKQDCILNVYTAIEGIGAATDALECSLGDFGEAMEMTVEDETPSQSQPNTNPKVPRRGTATSPTTTQPGSFQGIAPFGQNNSNIPTMQIPGNQYPSALPPHVVEMMNKMQQTYAPSQTQVSCQGVTTSALTGFDQSGNKSTKSKLEKFDVVQIVKSQQNGGRTYFLSTNGFWYDAGYIKKTAQCNL